MNPRMQWLAREVMPTLFGLVHARRQYSAEANAELDRARSAAEAAAAKFWEAKKALSELVNLLKGVGFTDKELDAFAAGPTAPADAYDVAALAESEVPL